MRTSVQAVIAPLCPFHTFWPKKSKILKNKRIPGDIIILHQCTKITITWYLIRKICGQHYKSFWTICAFYQIFGPKNQKILKKKTKTKTLALGYIIILHLHPKNHNHLMYSSLKMMLAALQVILGQFLPHFWPKIKTFEKWKNS